MAPVIRQFLRSLIPLSLLLAPVLPQAGCASREGLLPPVPEATPENPVPESTLSYLNECAEHWVDDLKERSYRIHFELTVTEHGDVRGVEPTGVRLDVRDMEKCMIGALGNMFVPAFVLEQAASERVSQRVSAQARGLIGQTDVMDDVLVTLVPIVIRAGPVVIVVVLGVVVVAAAVQWGSKEKQKRCTKQWEYGFKKCVELLSLPNPPRRLTGGYVNTRECAKGFVSQECGGNMVEEEKQGRPGRKY